MAFRWWKNDGEEQGKAADPGPFRWDCDHPYACEHQVIERLLKEYLAAYDKDNYGDQFSLKRYPSGAAMAGGDGESSVRYCMALVERLRHTLLYSDAVRLGHSISSEDANDWKQYGVVGDALGRLMQKKLVFSAAEIGELFSLIEDRTSFYTVPFPIGYFVSAVERAREKTPLPEDLVERLDALANRMKATIYTQHTRAFGERLLSTPASGVRLDLQPGEAWSDQAIEDLNQSYDERRAAWSELIAHCRSSTGSKPPGKWLKKAEAQLEHVGRDEFLSHVLRWFPLVDRPRTAPFDPRDQRISAWHENHISQPHLDILKGMAWCCSLFDDEALARELGSLALSGYKKLPGQGSRHIGLGNACVWALSVMPGDAGLRQLMMIKVRVKNRAARLTIGKSTLRAGERLGFSPDEIEEQATPTFGMTGIGELEERIGQYTAILSVIGTSGTLIRWRQDNDRVIKTAPKVVREEHPEELKALRAKAGDIKKMLTAQKRRIEDLFLAQRSWAFPAWRACYLDHSLAGVIARRLIWVVEQGNQSAAVAFLDGEMVGADDCPISWLDDVGEDVRVRLWHPIESSVEEVQAWRGFIVKHTITQPFKQAHREVYALTDTERATEVYSNRFAAHIIGQRQFKGLCDAREWRFVKRRIFDSDEGYPPRKDHPAWGVRSEFWIHAVEIGGDDSDTDGIGAFNLMSTDQVRFYPIDSESLCSVRGGYGWHDYRHGNPPDPVRLEEIPPLLFSEVMRDIDLFVGVSSIGNDPEWCDRGRDAQHVEYWQSYAFGELARSAVIRRETLEAIVPKLAIADRTTFDGRFMIVRGDLNTYRIHLGSSNVQISKGNRYLCIVPGSMARRSAGAKIYLPFEGDRTLAIILSKAMMLADDTKITDPSIVSQIRL